MALHPKMYRFDEALKRFNRHVERRAHKKITSDDNDKNKTTFCSYGDEFEVLPVVDASHLCARKAICLETLEVDGAQRRKELHELWIEATEVMTVDRRSKNEKIRSR